MIACDLRTSAMGVTFQKKNSMNGKSGSKSWFIMASCFPEIRPRTASMDNTSHSPPNKLAKLGRLFRSKSEDSVKGDSPPPQETSPKASPGSAPRRRMMRVVRNNESAGAEYVNPHVVRKYNQEFLEKQQEMMRSHSLDDEGNSPPLPYTVTGHTILKKHPSVDSESTGRKRHPSFKEEVEVLEFDKKGRCSPVVIMEPLHDDTDESTARAVLPVDADPLPRVAETEEEHCVEDTPLESTSLPISLEDCPVLSSSSDLQLSFSSIELNERVDRTVHTSQAVQVQ